MSNFIVKLYDFSLKGQIEKDKKEIEVIKSTWDIKFLIFIKKKNYS